MVAITVDLKATVTCSSQRGVNQDGGLVVVNISEGAAKEVIERCLTEGIAAQ
jgi:hypothetical protein